MMRIEFHRWRIHIAAALVVLVGSVAVDSGILAQDPPGGADVHYGDKTCNQYLFGCPVNCPNSSGWRCSFALSGWLGGFCDEDSSQNCTQREGWDCGDAVDCTSQIPEDDCGELTLCKSS